MLITWILRCTQRMLLLCYFLAVLFGLLGCFYLGAIFDSLTSFTQFLSTSLITLPKNGFAAAVLETFVFVGGIDGLNILFVFLTC